MTGGRAAPRSPMITAVAAAATEMEVFVTGGGTVTLFADFHSTASQRKNFFIYNGAEDTSPEEAAEISAFMELFAELNPDFTVGGSVVGLVDARRARRWAYETLDTHAITFETAYQDVQYGPRMGEYMTPDRFMELGEDFGRQFLWIEARPAAPEPVARADGAAIGRRAAAFRGACEARLARWREELHRMTRTDRRAAVWGAGSKGVTFLNLLSDIPSISCAVDVNPHKVGMHVAGTGHRISSPEELASGDPPHLVIVMNPLYVDEIRRTLESLGLLAECRLA